MYRVLGADGKEYGPVNGEVLRQWITEGRANAQTRVKAEGAGDWQTLASVPEFEELFALPAGAVLRFRANGSPRAAPTREPESKRKALAIGRPWLRCRSSRSFLLSLRARCFLYLRPRRKPRPVAWLSLHWSWASWASAASPRWWVLSWALSSRCQRPPC